MKRTLLQFLACPTCKSDLNLHLSMEKDGEIVEGKLECAEGESFPILGGVPRFVSTDHYSHTFSFQWNRFSRVQLDVANHTRESEETLWEKTGLSPDAVKGKLILDAGVGAGRFSEVASRVGAEVIGVDLSLAVDAAYQSIAARPNVHIVQADIFDLPFREQTFDFIFSIGVLHHTPDTRAAFQKLVPLLKRKGEIAIWVYDRYTPFRRITDSLRSITTRMPKRMVYYFSTIAIPLYYVKPFRKSLEGILRLCMHKNWRWRWLDTFDYYSPKFQWKHTYPEVFSWFQEAGLKDIAPLSAPVSMKGRRE